MQQKIQAFNFAKEIRKQSCIYCFATNENANGIYMCLGCGVSFCEYNQHLQLHISKQKHQQFVNIKKVKQNLNNQNQITELALNTDKGFQEEQFYYKYSFYCSECNQSYQANQLDSQNFIKNLQNKNSVENTIEKQQWQEKLKECQHVWQINQQWEIQLKSLGQCNDCDLQENLWLCITCGNLGCGRRFHDGTGGNDHGINHNKSTGHPIAIKLGTLSQQDNPSAFCYACEDDIQINNIFSLLSQLGLDLSKFSKKEKTLVEMSIELNQRIQLSQEYQKDQQLFLVEDFSVLGIKNVGNSCYLNSVLQLLFNSQAFCDQESNLQQHIINCNLFPQNCLQCQTGILYFSLKENNSKLIKEIVPYDFRRLVIQRATQFNNYEQQDAYEFLQLLLNKLSNININNDDKILKEFWMENISVLKCQNCNYKIGKQNNSLILNLNFSEDQKRIIEQQNAIDFNQILQQGIQAQDQVEYCPNCQKKTIFSGKQFLQEFPNNLLIRFPRIDFIKGQITKLNYQLLIQKEAINLQQLDIKNQDLSQVQKQTQQNTSQFEQQVQDLTNMGFDKQWALFAIQQTKGDLEQAVNLLITNIENPMFGKQLQNIQEIFDQVWDLAESFGTDKKYVKKVCKHLANQSTEDIINYILEHPEDHGQFLSFEPQYNDNGEREYFIKGNIVHLGASTSTGHYVSYISKNNTEYYLNDSQCYLSNHPRYEDSYLILLQRKSL